MVKLIIKFIFLIVAFFFFLFFITYLIGQLIFPITQRDIICVQKLTPACFLKTPICIDFPNPCILPPFWYQKN